MRTVKHPTLSFAMILSLAAVSQRFQNFQRSGGGGGESRSWGGGGGERSWGGEGGGGGGCR